MKCECAQCFYCATPLSPRHEHDHMPIPKRAGGTETVPSCLNCHDLKDRLPLSHWHPEDVAKAFKECGPLGRIFLAKLMARAADYETELERMRQPAVPSSYAEVARTLGHDKASATA